MSVNDQFGESKDFSAEVKRITESGLLSFFGGQSLHRFQVKVIVQMKVVKVLSVNQKVHHVVSLSANLQPSFNPVDFGVLEKFGAVKSLKKTLFALSFRSFVVQSI